MNARTIAIAAGATALVAGVGAWTTLQQTKPAATTAPKMAAAVKQAAADAEAGEVTLPLAQTPAAVQAAVAKLIPAGGVGQVTQESDEGITTYEVEYTEGGVKCAMILSAAGDLLEQERSIGEERIPAALLAALKAAYPGATLADPQLVTKTIYEVEIVSDGKRHEVKCDAAGNIMDPHHRGHEKEAKEGAGKKDAGKEGKKEQEEADEDND